jgi:hypothetical protein
MLLPIHDRINGPKVLGQSPWLGKHIRSSNRNRHRDRRLRNVPWTTLNYVEDKEGHAVIALFVLPLVLGYGPVAVWALSTGGPRRLWALCVGVLGAVIVVALLVSAVYSVPSTPRVVLYALAFLGPAILLATGFLAVANTFTRSRAGHLAASLAGVVIGLVAGLGLAIFALQVW